MGPIADECNGLLPFWWIATHALANLLGTPPQVQFEHCLHCTRALDNEFNIRYKPDIADHLKDMVNGSIATTDKHVGSISLVPAIFQKWAYIMTKEAAQRQPEHKYYYHALYLNDGEMPA
jgi:hypothetical protein